MENAFRETNTLKDENKALKLKVEELKLKIYKFEPLAQCWVEVRDSVDEQMVSLGVQAVEDLAVNSSTKVSLSLRFPQIKILDGQKAELATLSKTDCKANAAMIFHFECVFATEIEQGLTLSCITPMKESTLIRKIIYH